MIQDAPANVRRAVILLWISVALSLVEFASNWEWPELLADQMNEILAFVFISLAVSIALVVLVARRHNFARYLLLLGTIGWIVLYIVHPWDLSDYPWWSNLVSFAIIAVDLVAVWWLFSRSASEWFSRAQAS
jgi:hypothetical protein